MFQLSYACSEAAEGACQCKIQLLNDKVVWRTTAHSHMPNEYNLQAKVTLSRLWHAATESDCDIRELVANTMPLLSPNVVLYMPEAERLKVSLQASRRAAAKKSAGEPAPKRKPAAGKKRKAELVDKENLAKSENNAEEKDEPPAEDLTCFDSLQEQLEVSLCFMIRIFLAKV
jgi:hypothetical protein